MTAFSEFTGILWAFYGHSMGSYPGGLDTHPKLPLESMGFYVGLSLGLLWVPTGSKGLQWAPMAS